MATGQLTGGQGVGGELQITWRLPTPSEAGEYRCDVDTFSAQAHSIIFSQTINIAEAEVSMSDLVNEVYRLKLEKEQMEKTIHQLNQTGQTLTNSIRQLNLTNQGLLQTDKTMSSAISSINQTLASLHSGTGMPNVLFSAINSRDRYLTQNQ